MLQGVQLLLDHGTYICWLIITRCAHVDKSSFFQTAVGIRIVVILIRMYQEILVRSGIDLIWFIRRVGYSHPGSGTLWTLKSIKFVSEIYIEPLYSGEISFLGSEGNFFKVFDIGRGFKSGIFLRGGGANPFW